jgi:type II secretory pathway pseudopilin PulG
MDAQHRGSPFRVSDAFVVLILVGIVTAVALPGINRFMRSLELNRQAQQVATMLRVARQRAITENNPYVVWWSDPSRGWGWWDDDDNDGVRDDSEAAREPVPLPAWIVVSPSSANPFPSDTLRFFPDGSANWSGSVVLTNRDGYARSLSVVRPTGMVTVQ